MIILKKLIEKSKDEFENGNYELAIKYADEVRFDDKFYELAQFIKSSALIKLKKYDESLKILNELIRDDSYNELFWVDKLYCHVFLNEDEKAIKTLSEIDRIIDKKNKSLLLRVIRLSSLIGEYDMALKYCDYALDVDPNFQEVLYEKAMIVNKFDDKSEFNQISDKLMKLSDNSVLSLLGVFLLNLHSNNYRVAVDIINSMDFSNFEDDEYGELLKGVIYNQICDEFNVSLLIVDAEDLDLDDVLKVMLDFVDDGIDNGVVNGIQYFII